MTSYFDEASATWDSPDKVERARVLAHAIADALPLDPGWTVLDYGCGTGQLTWHLGERVGHVTLADVSAGMLDAARHHPRRDAARHDVIEFDLAIRPLDAPVDLVVSALALHHIADIEAVLANLWLSLRPGSWLAIAELDADPDNHFHHDHFGGHPGIDRDRLVRDLSTIGFEDAEAHTVTTILKAKHDVEREFDVFLATARRPG